VDSDRDARGRYVKGKKGGRIRGSQNRFTRYEALLHKHGEDALKALIAEAIQRRHAGLLAFYADRLVPKRGPRFVIAAPKMRSLADMPQAIAKVREMIADGMLTLDEGQALIRTYLAQGQAIETAELRDKVEAMRAEIDALRRDGEAEE
jgi:hypothetical protein